jgi:hypothetical protein
VIFSIELFSDPEATLVMRLDEGATPVRRSRNIAGYRLEFALLSALRRPAALQHSRSISGRLGSRRQLFCCRWCTMSNLLTTETPHALGAGLDGDHLWTLVRDIHYMRCSLRRLSTEYETRLLLDDRLVLTRTCASRSELVSLAERWRDRLNSAGWVPYLETITLRPKADRRNQTSEWP